MKNYNVTLLTCDQCMSCLTETHNIKLYSNWKHLLQWEHDIILWSNTNIGFYYQFYILKKSEYAEMPIEGQKLY